MNSEVPGRQTGVTSPRRGRPQVNERTADFSRPASSSEPTKTNTKRLKVFLRLVTMHSLGPGGWERLTEISLACYTFESSVELCVLNTTLKSPFSWSLSKAQDRGAKAFGEGCVCVRGSWQHPKLRLNPKYTGLVPGCLQQLPKEGSCSLYPGCPGPVLSLSLGRVAYCTRLLNVLLLILREYSLVSSVPNLQETLSISLSYPTK